MHVFVEFTGANAAVLRQILSGCFCWALPRFCLVCFVAPATKRMSGWGMCGSSCCVVVVFICESDLPDTGTGQVRYVPFFTPLMSLSGPCHSAFTAKLEEKKKGPKSGAS